MAEKKAKNKGKAKDAEFSSILMYPHLTEKSMKMVEMENKLVFMTRRNSKRKEIKEAIERTFNVKVRSVNFEITTRGEKKAYVKLYPEFSASDIASKMGMV
jgi:large subunit ribosomal protein L23